MSSTHRTSLQADLQSAYRGHHLTEMAVFKVLSDCRHWTPATYSNADTARPLGGIWQRRPCTLLQRLRKSYGLGGKIIDWFTSYLSKRKQQVCTRRHPVRCHWQFFLECHKARSLYCCSD